jgi:hypothetical protein
MAGNQAAARCRAGQDRDHDFAFHGFGNLRLVECVREVGKSIAHRPRALK